MKIPVFKTADQIRVVFPFKHVTPVVTIDIRRQDKTTHIYVYPVKPMDVHESFTLLRALYDLLSRIIGGQGVPDTIEVKDDNLTEAIYLKTSRNPLLKIIGCDADYRDYWAYTLLANDEVQILFWYKCGAGLYNRHLFTAGVKLRKLRIENLWKYLHLIMFVTHQICNGRYMGGCFAEHTVTLTVCANIEEPFDPDTAFDVLKTLKRCRLGLWYGRDKECDELHEDTEC